MQGVHDGFVKIFARRGMGVVVGGVVVAPRASELIHALSLAVSASLTVDQVADAFTVYPSLSGSVAEAARRCTASSDLSRNLHVRSKSNERRCPCNRRNDMVVVRRLTVFRWSFTENCEHNRADNLIRHMSNTSHRIGLPHAFLVYDSAYIRYFVTLLLVSAVLMPSAAQADGTEVTGGAPGAVAPPPADTKAAKVVKREIPTESSPKAGKPHAAPEPGEPDHSAANRVVGDLVQTDLRPFSMFGVTWKGGLPNEDTVVEARWRSKGKWSAWTELHVDPAPGEGGRPGTEPQWVDSADAAAVRVLSTSNASPRDLSLTLVDASTSTASASNSSSTPSGSIDVTPAATVDKPAIILRSAWGAAASDSCDSPRYGSTTRGAVIHHTAGSNSYSKSESAGIVKATQAYHMQGRDWCDIGYNFLVDKYGQIFEGRAGGIDKPVRAAHSGNDAVNQETMGVSMMGTFSSTEPSAAMKTAVVDLVSWRFAQYNLPAKGTYSLGGKTLNRIAGHRNVVSTECPGAKAYAWLSASGGLRDRVAGVLADGGTPPVTTVPSGLASTGSTPTSLTFSWNAVPDAPMYRIQLSTSSSMSNATYHRFTDTTGTITGLKANTKYYAKVRTIKTDGTNISNYSSAVSVTTPAATGTAVPKNLTSTAKTPTSLTFSWSPVTGAPMYRIQLSTSSSMSNATYYRFTDPTGTITGLKANTKYYAKVRTIETDGTNLRPTRPRSARPHLLQPRRPARRLMCPRAWPPSPRRRRHCRSRGTR